MKGSCSQPAFSLIFYEFSDSRTFLAQLGLRPQKVLTDPFVEGEVEEEKGESYSSKFQFHVIELNKPDKTKGKARKQELYRWAKLKSDNRMDNTITKQIYKIT